MINMFGSRICSRHQGTASRSRRLTTELDLSTFTAFGAAITIRRFASTM